MCTNCNEISEDIPIGEPGTDGTNGVSHNGINGTEETVVYDSSLDIIYTANEFISTIPISSTLVPDLLAWRTVGYIIFPGTDNLNNINPNFALMVGNVNNNNWLVRITNENNTIIAQSTSISNTTKQIINLGNISNLPTNLSILKIEVYYLDLSDPTSQIELNSLLLLN